MVACAEGGSILGGRSAAPISVLTSDPPFPRLRISTVQALADPGLTRARLIGFDTGSGSTEFHRRNPDRLAGRSGPYPPIPKAKMITTATGTAAARTHRGHTPKIALAIR